MKKENLNLKNQIKKMKTNEQQLAASKDENERDRSIKR